MIGAPFFVTACICCKCIKNKSNHIRNDINKQSQSRQDCKHKKSSGFHNSNMTTIQSNRKMDKKAMMPLYVTVDDDNDNDDDSCYCIPREHDDLPNKIFQPMMDEIPKKMKQKSISMENRLMQFFPKNHQENDTISKSSGSQHCKSRHLSQTESQISSTSSTLRTLLKSSNEKLHQSTRIIRSMLKKRFTNTPTSSLMLASTKEMKSLMKARNAKNSYSFVLTVPTEIGGGCVELGMDKMKFIDVDEDDSNCCRNKYTMKRGFRYLFNQEKLNNRDGKDDSDDGIEEKRGFFQKFFQPISIRSLADGEGTSAEVEGRPLLYDENDYAVIDKQPNEIVISINKEKREMSAPISPKSVTFEDELFSTPMERRGQSVAPRTTFLNNFTETISPIQKAFNNFNYDASQISTITSRRDIQSPQSRSNLSDRSPTRSSRDASLALDKATHDLLRLSSQPSATWYSSSSRLLPAADRIPKSASTTSMNKVIRTKDGGMLKLTNAFTWDSARLHDHDSSNTSTYIDDEGRRHQTVTIYTDERRQGPPIIRTTVEGKLKMEKVVGADLISVEYCTCSAWTIRDTITHYKVKTTLGNRTLIMEEHDKNDGNRERDFKMSLYENDQLKASDIADFRIPSNVDKKKYLSLLSQRLLRDIKTLDQRDEQKITTRVEVEVTENVTKMLKTYIIGERKDLSQEIPINQAITDKMTTRESIIQRYSPSPCINVECNLKRMEDHSLIEVNVAMPNVFSAVLSLIRERILSELPNFIRYGMEQHGKQYSGETTIRRLHHFDSTESEEQTTMIHTKREPSFFFEKPEIIEPVKIPALNITELDLRRMADTSAILANFAIPRTDQYQLDIERRHQFHEARGGSYGMRQEGQYFEGETILRKKRRFSSASETVSEEEIISESTFLNSGSTYLNLVKNEARGEFEVAIVISNDERYSPKSFQESQSVETINLIAVISTDGKKEEVLATLAIKIKSKEMYMIQEMSTVNSNVMITIQKMINLDDIFQQSVQRWNDKIIERITVKLSEFNDEQAQIFVIFTSSTVECQDISAKLPIRLEYSDQMRINEFGNEKEYVAVLLQRAGIMNGQVQHEWAEAITDIPPIIRMDETKTEDAYGMDKIYSESKFETKQERLIPIKQIQTEASSNINNEQRFINAQERWNTKSENARMPSVRPFDSDTTSDHPFRRAEWINDNRRVEKIFDESRSYLRNSHSWISQCQESISRCNNVHEVVVTWNEIARSHKKQFEYEEKRKSTNFHEFLYDKEEKGREEMQTSLEIENQEQLESSTSEIRKDITTRIEEEFDESRENVSKSKMENEELRRELYNETSETRIAMLHAGFDLDTILLATPEALTQSKFARDYSMTTSEYFSDERSWSVTTESYYKQRKSHLENLSKSAGDLIGSSLEENLELFDEISHISDSTYSNMKYSEIADAQMSRSLTTGLEASTLKECFTTTENEFNIRPETFNYDVIVGRSEQCEASSFTFSSRYHQLTQQPKQAINEAAEALIIQEKEKTDSKMDESSDLRSFLDVQSQASSLGFEDQHNIFQPTTSITTKVDETIEHITTKPIEDKYITAINTTSREMIEISKQEIEYNFSKIDYGQAISKAISTSAVVAEVSIPVEEISHTDRTITSDKLKRSNEQAWSKTVPITSHDLVTTLQMSTMISENIDSQNICKERDNQFHAVVHFPSKSMNKSFLGQITQNKTNIAAKIPETKIFQQQKTITKEREQIRQFESTERQMTTVSIFRDSEFLEEMEQVKRETEGPTKYEQELRQFHQIERRSTNIGFDSIIQADRENKLELSQLELEMKKTPAIENALVHSNLINYHQTAIAIGATKEEQVIHDADFKYISDRVDNIDKSMEMKNFEETSENLEAVKTEQRNIMADYKTVEREASIDKSIDEKSLATIQMMLQATQVESVDNSNLLAHQEVNFVSETEVNFEISEYEATIRNFTFVEEYQEQMLCKPEEGMVHVTNVEMPNKETAIMNATEYNKEVTSLNGIFLRISVQEIAEQCMEVIADKLKLQVNVDAKYASSENVTEDIILGGPIDQWSVAMVVPEEMTIQEYINLQSTVDSCVTQQSVFEKHQDNFLETSTNIRSSRTEKEYARHPETAHEAEALVAGWSKVVRKASTEKAVYIGETQTEKLSTRATTEQNIDFSGMIEKLESVIVAELKLSLNEAAVDEKQLRTAYETQDYSLLKESSDETCTSMIANLEVIQAQGRVIEYGTEQVATTNSFAKLEQKEIAEKVEKQFAASIKLEIYLDTQFPTSESASLDIELENDCNIRLDKTHTIVQKPVVKFITTLKAIHEEVESVINEFEIQEDHLSNIGCVLSDNTCETASSHIHEFGDEHQQYMASWDVLQNAMSTETYVAVAETQSMACNIDAVKEEDVQIVEQIKYPEFFGFIDKTISLKPYESEIGEWKIVQGNTDAIFQQLDEQIAEEAININDRYSEKQIGIFQQYGSTSTETIAHFARILLKKIENYEAKISNSISRHCKECLNLEASKESIEILEQSFLKVESTEIAKRTMREVHYAKITVDFISTSEIYVTHVIMFDKQSQCESVEIVLNGINREQISSEEYIEQSEVAKLIDTTWDTIVNDFDTAINIYESNREQVVFDTTASQELQLESISTLFMKPSSENAFVNFHTITAVSGGERQFKIESAIKESILARQQEQLFAEGVQKTTFRAEDLAESIAESSEVQSDAGILLMRRSATKTTEAVSHVIGIALTLSQYLETQHAQETSKEASVEFFIPSSNQETENKIRESIINRGISLETEYAKTIALQETVELTKSRKVLSETESILKGAHTEAIREKMKEADSEGFEILSQWTTVDRDLEAEVSFQHKRNAVSIFTTIATTEEEISIDQTWVAMEHNLEAFIIRNIVASKQCERSFQIEFEEMRFSLEEFKNEGSCGIIWCDKNYDMLHVSMHESILKKLNAIINLHCVSNILPKQTANEYIWRDQRFITAIPLYIKCEDIETDYTTVDIILEQQVAQKFFETVQISANWLKAEIFECEQVEDEKIHMLVEMDGKRFVKLGVEIIWPEPNKDDGIVVDVEEYMEDQAILYTQLTSEQVLFAEFSTTITISHDYEPQMLIASSTKEEIVDGYDEFRIPSEANAITHVVIIGNKGECLSVWLQEIKQNFVTIGFQYTEENQAYEMEGNFIEKRFGGNYQLKTKAAKTEDRDTTMAMLRRIENETISEVLNENVKYFTSMEIFASISEMTVIDINWQKAQEIQTASMQYYCSRKMEPIRSHFLEIDETMHTVHAQFKIKESSLKFPIIWKIPNYGGHLTLNTKSVKETIVDREIVCHKNEAFEITIIALKEVIKMIAPILAVKYITEEMQEISEDLIRPLLISEAYLCLKQANKGINIKMKLIETTDVRQTSYLQFEREVESVELEKTIREARFGGKSNLTTYAAEKYELNVTRELTSSVNRVAHCNQLIVSRSWNRGTYYEAIATTSESIDIPIILRKLENTDDIYCITCKKSLMKNILNIQESEAVALTINLNYIKERAKEISEKTIWLARNAGPCILTTFAARDEQKLIQWILEKRRDTILSASTTIIIKNILKVVPLDTIQSESIEIVACPNLQHIVEMHEACKTLIAPNRGYDMCWKLYETCEETESSNYQFKQESMMKEIETILRQSCYGGHSILNTSAVKESAINLVFRLESKLPAAEIDFLINISNKSIPIIFSTKSSVSIENNELIILERKPEIKDAAITRKVANIDMMQKDVVEISLETESIIIKYQHKEEHVEIQKIIFLAFYGGHQKLETLAASEIIANICECFMSKHLMFAETHLHRVIANIANPCKLSVQSSKHEENNQEYYLQKKQISEDETASVLRENEIALTLRVANYEFAKFITTESSNEIETINAHWQRNEMCEEVRLCVKDKLFGGNVLLSTYFAQESAITFTAALTAARSNLQRVSFTIYIARHSMDHPIFATLSATEIYAEFNCHLNCPSVDHQSMITIHTANQIGAMIVQLIESTFISETTNIQYQRPNAMYDAFSEVFPEKRFGGSLILNTLATKETMINIQSSHSSQNPKQLEIQIIFTDKNRATEMYHMLATTEQNIARSIQFQKASDLFNVGITKRASRRGDDRCFTFTESSEINEFSNFSWKNTAEISANQVTILKEIRYGGHLVLDTKHASEQVITITDTLKQTFAELASTITRKAANQGVPISIACLSSQENHISISLELQSKKLAQFDVSVRHEAANREVPLKLITNESSELMLATNVTMQKTLDYESMQTLWKAKNDGGIIALQCNASRESYAELYNCLESRLSLKQHFGVTSVNREVRYGEHITMNLMATEETIFNLEISLEKQNIEDNKCAIIKTANIALPEMLKTLQSLESKIEVESVEVWKHVSAIHVESALKLARECLPISLRTDSAQETFIRHEAEMRIDIQRINGMTEIEKSSSIMEHETLACTEDVNITLRPKFIDEEQEQKVEKRVSFAAEVTEKMMSMDMSVTVEQQQIPVIVKKPMKKEQHSRRSTLRQNEAPNFIPVRRNSLLLAMDLGDGHNIPHYKTLEDVIKGIKKAGLEYSNLIFGIDYTKSNKYQGERTFDGRNLHTLCSDELNPYQQVIEIVGKTLSSFDADGVIPTYGFGDEESSDHGIFNLIDKNDMNAECNGFEEVLRIYNDKTPFIRMSGPTNFVPLIEQAISIVREKHSYHILVIVADGQVTNEKINQKAIAAASRYPLSIIMVGVGDGPWNMMTRFDETLPKRMFDNFHFVDFHKVMFNAPNQEASFALNALMEIPDQYKAIKELGLLKQSRRG